MVRKVSFKKSVQVTEYTPLLRKVEEWQRPRGFWWIETALWANVFLSGFDGTITASTYTLISSEFNAANSASWLTTSYLITSTAFQPLYGRFSDIFGRRVCFFVSTITFLLGCLGCSLANHIFFLNAMRALTGIGGGGLITMATIINSDMIPFERRGMYQAAQNILVGFGAVSGASLGGFIAQWIGWRWCFLLQVPCALLALIVGYVVLENPTSDLLTFHENMTFRQGLAKVDICGSILLVAALLVQLLGLSLGGNEVPWTHPLILVCVSVSCALLVIFVVVESTTKLAPIVPLRMLRGRLPISVQITNVFAGMASYAYLFLLPLFFQIVLLDSPAQAGARLIVPSLSTPIGGVIAGYTMSRYGRLAWLVRFGTTMMLIGNVLAASFGFTNMAWKYVAFLVPANLGLGMTNPSVLFSFVSAFEHSEQAVATSLVYLIRSLGTIYGVTFTSAIVQNMLVVRLHRALHFLENHHKIIEDIRRSVLALRSLPPEIQIPARKVYYEAIQYAFIASSVFAACAMLASFVANGKGLQRNSSCKVEDEEN